MALQRHTYTMSNLAEIPSPLILFDGECILCNRTVRMLLKYDTSCILYFTPNSSITALRVFGQFGIETDEIRSIFFFDGKRLFKESDAVIEIIKRLPRPFTWLSVTALIPRIFRDWSYRVVARTRYRIFGKTTNWSLLGENERRRVIL